jgi:hypothetical protein
LCVDIDLLLLHTETTAPSPFPSRRKTVATPEIIPYSPCFATAG